MTSLVLYANDHLNNFVHIFLDNGTQVVYLFNHGNVIHNVTVEYPNLNTSTSVQIAITRTLENTTVYVNERTATIPVGVLLLDEYSNKPWNNSEKGNRIRSWFRDHKTAQLILLYIFRIISLHHWNLFLLFPYVISSISLDGTLVFQLTQSIRVYVFFIEFFIFSIPFL